MLSTAVALLVAASELLGNESNFMRLKLIVLSQLLASRAVAQTPVSPISTSTQVDTSNATFDTNSSTSASAGTNSVGDTSPTDTAPNDSVLKPPVASPEVLDTNRSAPVALAQWIGEATEKSGSFPRTLVFVSSLPRKGKGTPEFLDVDRTGISEISYFKVADPSNAKWDLKLNRQKYAKSDSAKLAIELTGADTIVVASEKGKWRLVRFKANKRETIITPTKPASLKPDEIVSWLFLSLNWDGVVLDRRSDVILVGSSAAFASIPETQALAVDRSAKKWRLKARDRKGAGLLSLSESKGGYSIFDIVFLGRGVSNLDVGTKIIIERKN